MSPVSCGLWSRGAGDVLSHSSPGRSPLVARSWPYSPSGWGQVGGEAQDSPACPRPSGATPVQPRGPSCKASPGLSGLPGSGSPSPGSAWPHAQLSPGACLPTAVPTCPDVSHTHPLWVPRALQLPLVDRELPCGAALQGSEAHTARPGQPPTPACPFSRDSEEPTAARGRPTGLRGGRSRTATQSRPPVHPVLWAPAGAGVGAAPGDAGGNGFIQPTWLTAQRLPSDAWISTERLAAERSRLWRDPVRDEPEAVGKQAGHTLPACEVPGTAVTGSGGYRGPGTAQLLLAETALQTRPVHSPSLWAGSPHPRHLTLVLGSLSTTQAPCSPAPTVYKVPSKHICS